MNSLASVPKKDTGKQPSRERASRFTEKKPLFDITFVDRHGAKKDMIIWGRDDQDLLDALKEDPRLRIKTEENKKYGEENVGIRIKDGDKTPPMIIEKTKTGGIQVYDENGLPYVKDEEGNIIFLNMKNLAPKKLIKLTIQEDNGDKYLKDMKTGSEEGGSFHAGEGKSTNGLKFNTWDIWVETEQQKSEHRIAEEKYVEKSQEYFVKTQFNSELILPAREMEGSRTENFIHKPEAHGENNGIGHHIWKHSRSEQSSGAEYSQVPANKSKIQDFDASPKTEIEARLYQIINFDAKEFPEEESPIIRCIMDPAFRKIYGAMYGFIDPEEYHAGETKPEPVKYEKRFDKERKTPGKIKKSEKRESKEQPELRFEYNLKNKKMAKKRELKKELSEYKKSGKKKNKTKKEKKIPKEPPKIRRIRKGKEKIARIWRNKKFGGIKIPKIGEIRRFEEFLSKEFKLSKIKIEKFKLMMNKLSKEVKHEIKLLIQKVQEFFKLKERLIELKNELNKNWILNYTKTELRKIFVEIEYKVQALKKEIKKMLDKIRVMVRNNTNFVLRLGDKVKALRKLERIILFFLLFKAFNED